MLYHYTRAQGQSEIIPPEVLAACVRGCWDVSAALRTESSWLLSVLAWHTEAFSRNPAVLVLGNIMLDILACVDP